MKFLIVEDEILIQKSIKKMLELKGHEVDTTVSGTQALELLRIQKYDRVICDLMLKDITGFEVLEECKTLFSSEIIKEMFIIITAYSSDQILNLATQYGCNLIKKPFIDIKSTIDFFIYNRVL